MIYIDNKNPIMEVIRNVEADYNTKAEDAIIREDTIIPGINGKEINKHKSLVKMEEFGVFNETYLVYNIVKPNISLEDNKDKVIIKGNSKKRNISLILDKNLKIEKYLNDNNIKYDIIAKLGTDLNIKREYLNGESDEKDFSDLNSLLKKHSLNKKICLINYSNNDTCQKKKYYLVSNSLLLNNTNYLDLINKLNSGDIVLITSQTSLDTFKLMLNEIKKLDLNIVYLSELISE